MSVQVKASGVEYVKDKGKSEADIWFLLLTKWLLETVIKAVKRKVCNTCISTSH